MQKISADCFHDLHDLNSFDTVDERAFESFINFKRSEILGMIIMKSIYKYFKNSLSGFQSTGGNFNREEAERFFSKPENPPKIW